LEVNKVIDIALTAGEILLGNGAESYRIDETVAKICLSYGVTAECLSMSNGILLSVVGCDCSQNTAMKRVRQKHVDLYRIELINAFSRELETTPLSYEQAKKRLQEIDQAPNFSLHIRTMAACMTGFIYTLFFNGTLPDAFVSILICLAIYRMLEKVAELGFFQFMEFYFAGLAIGGASILAHTILPEINENNVISGAIMILIPGVTLTNGIKDALYGDFFSGLAKFYEAMLVVTAVCAGIATALFIGLKGW